MPIQLIAPNVRSVQDVMAVTRGPIVYTAEGIDNEALESVYPHFVGVGLTEDTEFVERSVEIGGVKVVMLETRDAVHVLEGLADEQPYRVVCARTKARTWEQTDKRLVYVPWFARGNRGGNGHIRTMMLRVS